MSRIERVIVAIPARNEADRLPSALDAVRAATGVCLVPVVVVVAADACTDATADIAASHGAHVVISDAGRVGAARAAAIATALEHLQADPERVWIDNTDADSIVPPDWLTLHLEFAERGVALLRGAVRPDARELAAEQSRRWLTIHPSAEDHDHVHGANLGLTAAAYLAAGGFQDLPLHEDVELVRRVAESGRQIASTLARGGSRRPPVRPAASRAGSPRTSANPSCARPHPERNENAAPRTLRSNTSATHRAREPAASRCQCVQMVETNRSFRRVRVILEKHLIGCFFRSSGLCSIRGSAHKLWAKCGHG